MDDFNSNVFDADEKQESYNEAIHNNKEMNGIQADFEAINLED
jgi:hypothetical protein